MIAVFVAGSITGYFIAKPQDFATVVCGCKRLILAAFKKRKKPCCTEVVEEEVETSVVEEEESCKK